MGFKHKYRRRSLASGLDDIFSLNGSRSFLVELVIQGIKRKFKILNKEIKTKKNLDNSKIGFGIKTQIKIMSIFKLL